MADDFEITALCARYPGARPRTENGVHYRFIGLPLGRFGSLISYFVAIPFALLRYQSDLVVEDFGAPLSTVGVPRMTRRPVIGVVQWLFAREKARQYRIPFHLIEAVGLRAHRELIAVSNGLADELRARNPIATVHVIENGLEVVDAKTDLDNRTSILFIGRLDIAQKGVDLLLRAFACVRDDIDLGLVIAGDGPDRDTLKSLAADLDLGGRVKFVGWVPAERRIAEMAAAQFVVMPSRYETFGMVAAEALSVATPVIAFDIPCLRDLLQEKNGILVPAFDIGALAEAMRKLASDPQLRASMSDRGPDSVAHLSWDLLAERQRDIYRRAIEAGGERVRMTTGPAINDQFTPRSGQVTW